jgi:hypothetical protein
MKMKRALGKQQIAILRYFKHLGGGRGLTIGDARKAARVEKADYHIKRLIKAGFVKWVSRNNYRLASR